MVDAAVLIYGGFILSVLAFTLYWSMILEDGIIKTQMGRWSLRCFGSIPRIMFTHLLLSVTVGAMSIWWDFELVSTVIAVNLAAQLGFIAAGVYLLDTMGVVKQVKILNYVHRLEPRELDEDIFNNALDDLVDRLNSQPKVQSFLHTLLVNYPQMGPIVEDRLSSAPD